MDKLFFLDGHPQAEWACEYDVAPVKLSKEFYTLSGNFDTDPEIVVYVALERLNVVIGIGPFGSDCQLIHSIRGQSVLR